MRLYPSRGIPVQLQSGRVMNHETMVEIPITRVFLLILAIILVLALELTVRPELAIAGQVAEETLQGLRAAIPKKIGGWSAEAGDQFFDQESIFNYIDGGAEVYRAYNMRGCFSRRYVAKGGPSVILDIFDMGSSKDAFGIFTYDRDGESLDIGQDAQLRPDWLTFWKDRFFVSIYAEDGTDAAQKMIKGLGKAVTSLIKAQGQRPSIVSLLPSQGLELQSIRYLHNHIVLNSHFYLANENILDLASDTEAVLAEYRVSEEEGRLLLVRYPDEEKARNALANLQKNYLPEADSHRPLRLENGKWSAARLNGKLLAIVFEADSRSLADSLLATVAEAHNNVLIESK